MTDGRPFDPASDPRLADLGASERPAWLWQADGAALLWANATGLSVLGAVDASSAASGLSASERDMLARLSWGLAASGAPRLERLRLGAAGALRPLTCRCSRLRLPDGRTALLIEGLEAGRPSRPAPSASPPPVPEPASPPAPVVPEAIPTAVEMTTVHDRAEVPADEPDQPPPVIEEAPPVEAVAEPVAGPLAEPVAEDAVGTETPIEPAPAEPTGSRGPQDADAVPRRGAWRFVWQMDEALRFTAVTPDLSSLVGERGRLVGTTWVEIAARCRLDPGGRVAEALASRDTFSGIVVDWPVEGSGITLTVELAGLPVYDRNRDFRGYRGFGVCREVERLAEATKPAPPAEDPAPRAEPPAIVVADNRPSLALVPPTPNVVPLRTGSGAERRAQLTPVESRAFLEIARALGARVEGESAGPASIPAQVDAITEPVRSEEPAPAAPDKPAQIEVPPPVAAPPALPLFTGRDLPRLPDDAVPSAFPAARDDGEALRMLADRLPIGLAIVRDDRIVHANRTLLDWTGDATVDAFAARNPLSGLAGAGNDGAVRLARVHGEPLAVTARLVTLPWDGEPAAAVIVTQHDPEPGRLVALADARARQAELAIRDVQARSRDLEAILDTATDGVIVVDRTGTVLDLNRSAEALFGYDAKDLLGRPLTVLFAPESHRSAKDYLEGLTQNGVASVLNDGREVIGRVREGGLIPLFMTMGRIGEAGEKLAAVFRDITQWKKAEEELLGAKREAERASSAKSDFLAKISHEIRTPLNAIIGFSEVMMEERFGPMGNERYREYLKDIHTSGAHLLSLLNDLLDLSKIEAGKLDLSFTSVAIDDLVQQSVAIMQPQANRERIIIRTSLSGRLPPVVADARSVRQIVLNLLSNAVRFTQAGGQVIVSTALTEGREVVIRVRDTGIGMSDKELATAMEPFRQLATTSRPGAGGTGLGLPLTKALAEANRATFSIKSAVNAGTLVEITFPANRVLAE